LLPIPTHRKDVGDDICIELFYSDQDIMKTAVDDRRLFLSNEFRPISGLHISGRTIVCRMISKVFKDKISIIDSNVFDGNDKSLALSKNDFANNILDRAENFRDMDFTEFRTIFQIFERIADDNPGDLI
jgi:RNA-directed DNA polymerase